WVSGLISRTESAPKTKSSGGKHSSPAHSASHTSAAMNGTFAPAESIGQRNSAEFFGLPPDQFPPTYEGYLERVHPEDRSTTKKIIEQAFVESKPFDFEERIIRPDGEIRTLHSQGQ